MLQNAHILVTRPQEQAVRLCDELRQRGAIPVLYAGLAFAPCDDILLIDAEVAKAANGGFDLVILTSPQAAHVISERLAALTVSWQQVSVWVVGAKTADDCQFECNLHVPPNARDAQTLLEALPDVRGHKILLPQSPLAASGLRDELVERGAEVMLIHPYRVTAAAGNDDVPNLLQEGMIQAMTFFSGSAVEGVISRLDSAGLSRASLSKIPAVCFGSSAASAARHRGLAVLEGDATYETFYRLLEQACS